MLESIKDDAKMPFFIGAFCIVLLALFALFWVLKKDYQPIFTDLNPEDSAAMIEQLDKIEANYRVNQSSGTLEVPASELHSTRLKLMSSDVALAGGVGYEVFDNSDFGMTEFAQKINYQRALEGELQRTITALEQVRHARVHLVMPDRNLFRDDQKEPTASVTLLLQDGASLSSEQTTGIQRLVSASVPNLKENMVTISDHNGKTLTPQIPADQSVQMVPWQLQQKMNAEDYLVEKINKVLGKAFDLNQVSISVDIIMDFSQVKKTEEQVIPIANGRGIYKEKESRLGGGASSKNKGQNVTREVEYKMGRSVAETVESPGRITRINIGIMLPASLSEQGRQDIQRLIEVTAGINPERGDSVAIYAYNAVASEVSTEVPVQDVLDNKPTFADQEIFKQHQDGLVEAQQAIQPPSLVSALNQYWQYLIVIVLVTFLLALMVVRLFTGQREQKLSVDEREKVLMQLQHWLSEAK